MPDRNTILLGVLAGLQLTACRGAPDALDAGAPTITAPMASASTPLAPDAARDPRAVFLAHGPLHAEPIHVPAPVSAWLGFLGDPAVARAAWAITGCVEPAPCTAQNLSGSGLDWPVAVRVLGHRVDQARRVVYVRVATVGLLGQPADLTSVVPVQVPGVRPPDDVDTSDWALRLAGVRSDEELSARLSALRAGGVSTTSDEEQRRLRAMFTAAGASAAALGRAVDPAGLDVEIGWQRRFRQPLAHLAPREIARAPHLGSLLSIVREAGTACPWAVSDERERPAGICASNHGFVVLHRRPDGSRIQAVILDEPAAERPTPLPATRIPALAPSPATLSAARELAESAVVLAEAPWSDAGGTIALAEIQSGTLPDLAAITIEGPYARSQKLWVRGAWDGRSPPEVAFADVDGDGRADLVLKYDAASSKLSSVRVFLSPRDARSASAAQIDADVSVAPFLRGATSLDDAVNRALGAPRGALDPKEARASLAARRLSPGALAFHAAESAADDALDELPIARIQRLLPACTDPGSWELSFSCDPSRPVCQAHCRTAGGTGEPGSYFTYVLTPDRHPPEVMAIVTDRWFGAPP